MAPDPTLLAIDLGTQSLRLAAITARGERPWSWSRPVPSLIDGALNEQDPTLWLDLLREGLAEAGRATIRPAALAAAGPLAGYVPIAADGTPLAPAAMYFDRRSAPDVAVVAAVLSSRADALRPSIADPYPHALRLRRERPDILARTSRLLDATGFLVHALTGVATIDEYTALRLYDPWVARKIGIDPHLFGRRVRVGDIVGPLRPEFASAFGVDDIPVVAATFDSKCAYLASGIARPGEALDISGTVTSFGVASDRRIVDPERRIYSVPFRENWLVRGSMGGAGSILEWARTEMLGGDLEAIESAAAAMPPGAGGVTFLPYHSGARAPLWEPQARGAVLGLSLDTGRPALARALYEGLAFGLRHIVDAMEACGARVAEIRLAGGLARSGTLARIKADVLGRAVTRLADHELTTLGLAVIAGTATGVFPDHGRASAALVTIGDRFEPTPSRVLYEEPYRRYLAAVEALRPTFAPEFAACNAAAVAPPRSEAS